MFVSLLVRLFLRQSLNETQVGLEHCGLGLLILLFSLPGYWNYQGTSQYLVCHD